MTIDGKLYHVSKNGYAIDRYAKGLHEIDGGMYYVKEDGSVLTNSAVEYLTFNANGRYTSGNATLDSYVDQALAACTNSGMTKAQKLRAAYLYVRDHGAYLARPHQARGTTAWAEESALFMFEHKKGNCYCFAGQFLYMARRLGYNAYVVSGGVGRKDSDHAYSDMAIGLGLCFGFHFKENFNYPYISASIQEFWRRWHISLSTWFREYLYIPLGGNRKGKAKTYWNKLIVFFCTGLWHGANWTFIVWGLWHGFFIVAEDAVKKLFGLEKHGKDGQNPACAVLKHLYTLLVVLVGFVIFRADNMGQAFSMIGAMFSGGSASAQTGLLLAQCLTPLTLFALAVGLVGSTPVLPLVCRKAEQQTGSVYACLQALSYAGVLALLLVDILHLSAASYVPFIYFQF